MERNQKQSFIKGAAILAAASLICKVLGVLFRVFAIRILGEEGMFFYEKVYPTYSWLLIISSSGIPIAISRMVAARVARGAYDEADTVFKKAFRMLLVLGLVTTAVMLLGAQPIAKYLLDSDDPGMRRSLMSLAPALFFTSILCAYRGYLQGLQRMNGTGLSQLAEQVFKMLFGLSLAYVLYRYYDTPNPAAAGSVGILLGVTISEALAVAVIYPIYRKERKALLPTGSVEAATEQHVVRDLLVIALPITLGASILPIANVLDSAMITRLLIRTGFPAPDAERMYVVLCTYVRSIINLPAGISTSLSMAVVPAIAAAMARKDAADVKRLSATSIKLAMAIGLPCAVGLSVLARPAIFLLYGSIRPESLDLAESLMHIAAFTVVFISLSQTATGALQGVGRQRLPVYFLLIGGVTKVVVNIVCVSNPRINIYGAVFSNLSCYGIAALLDTIALVVVTKSRLNVLDTFLKPIFAAAVMGGFAYFTYRGIGLILDCSRYLYSALACVAAIVAAILVYLVLMLALRIFSREELALIPGGRKLMRFYK
ncbi:MAG: polysaccharide biosynthesis protein [Clostridia bacterium]|nr:polysaccharide biosynthesis protein [Clostridia bacterium]